MKKKAFRLDILFRMENLSYFSLKFSFSFQEKQQQNDNENENMIFRYGLVHFLGLKPITVWSRYDYYKHHADLMESKRKKKMSKLIN